MPSAEGMAAPKSSPKDAQVMSSILKDMGIIEYEPRVINLMLEFTYRYVTNILDDARQLSNHAKKKVVDADDVRLAIQLQTDRHFTSPPPRDLLMEIARQKNSQPLPLIKANAGPRLPSDRYSLTSCNYRLKLTKKSKMQVGMSSQLGLSSSNNSGLSKVTPAINLNSKSGATLAVVSKSVPTPTVTIVSRPAMNAIVNKPAAPSPIIKLSQRPTVSVNVVPSSASVSSSAAGPPSTATPSTAVTVGTVNVSQPSLEMPAASSPATPSSTPNDIHPIINIKSEPYIKQEFPENDRKRKRDDDYDAD